MKIHCVCSMYMVEHANENQYYGDTKSINFYYPKWQFHDDIFLESFWLNFMKISIKWKIGVYFIGERRNARSPQMTAITNNDIQHVFAIARLSCWSDIITILIRWLASCDFVLWNWFFFLLLHIRVYHFSSLSPFFVV